MILRPLDGERRACPFELNGCLDRAFVPITLALNITLLID